ncbi:MAG TPA: FAD-binding oxidoreductase [Chloroflexia bacterium]|nr:FAD-binding oxidoreductase [Chloroflexia bacterium]
MKKYQSWGHYPYAPPAEAKVISWRDALPELDKLDKKVLPYGLGRSYGDSCLNEGGIVLDTSGLNRFISFDEETGIIRCDSGVSLAEILEVVVPRGWFLPVTPGTKFVTIGGAIANDVHGKNHHVAGTFGCHVTQFELLRSNGQRLLCSPTENADLYAATIGGLGLTGLILWAEFKLQPIENSLIDKEQIKFHNLEEFFELADVSDRDFDYTVSFIDCLATGKNLGRGLFMRGNHDRSRYRSSMVPKKKLPLKAPFDTPSVLLNKLTLTAFNTMYYNTQLVKRTRKLVSYDPFFYPLDSVQDWNRLYGDDGFMQYQFVVPFDNGYEVVKEALERIQASGVGSFLGVLKKFGYVESPGMLSFPRPGVTAALDFPVRGTQIFQLLNELDQLVKVNGGRVYPAKDARMSAESFQAFYPNWRDFARFVDPQFSSSFWRRVTVNTEPEQPQTSSKARGKQKQQQPVLTNKQ